MENPSCFWDKMRSLPLPPSPLPSPSNPQIPLMRNFFQSESQLVDPDNEPLESPSYSDFQLKTDVVAWIEHNHDLGKSLKILSLELPNNIEKIPDSIGRLVDLTYLYIRGFKLKSLPETITSLHNLETLSLQEFFSLEKLPANFNELVKLQYFYVRSESLKSLPNNITRLPNLLCLYMEECFSMNELPSNMNELVSLKYLIIRGCNIKSLPNTITGLYDLNVLVLKDCFNLEELPENLNDLVSLNHLSITGSSIRSLPDSILELPDLVLELEDCFSLQKVPANLNELVNGTAEDVAAPPRLVVPVGEVGNSHQQFEIGHTKTTPPPPPNAFLPEEGFGEVSLYPALSLSVESRREVVSQRPTKCQKKKTPENKHVKAKKQISLQDIQPLLSGKVTLVEAAKELGVSRSTLKRKCREYNIYHWPSSRTKKHPHGANNQKFNTDSESQLNLGNSSRRIMMMRTAQSQSYPDGGGFVELGSGARQVGGSGSVIVKALYKEHVMRFDFSLTSDIAELKKEVGKRLNLELSKLEIEYLDDDGDWVLMACDDDLQYCLCLSRLSGSNRVKLRILDS